MNFTTECSENRYTDIANFATLIHTKKLIHSVTIFTILYGNYYPHGEFKLKWPKVSIKSISLCSMAIIAMFL